MGKRFSILFTFLAIWNHGLSQVIVKDVSDVIKLAQMKSIDLKSGEIKLDQAKKSRIAAILSIPDVGGSIGLSYTHNTRLPVSLFPAEIFGGQPGEYREIQTGVPYNSLFNENIDIKLLNLKGWQNLRLANATIEQQKADNLVKARDLDAAVSKVYFDVLTLMEQHKSAYSNSGSAKKLLEIVQDKYLAGSIREQDLLDAKSNYVIAMDNHQQIGIMIQEQLNSLRLLCDIPEEDSLELIMPDLYLPFPEPLLKSNRDLDIGSKELSLEVAKANLAYQKMSLMPSLSFFQSFSNQQFSTEGKLFNRSVDWVPSSYVGLKLSFQIPSATTVGQISKYRYDALLAEQQLEKEKIKVGIEQRQRFLTFNKHKMKTYNDEEVYGMRKRTYEKVMDLYREGLISIDRTLDSYRDMVDAGYGAISSRISTWKSLSQISIYNVVR